ncbi:hypothetical protein EVAR_93962_1 [Eumeta japonica]|uniref:Uncharacterized protein n=1 Tax=Eumeta variegata TaxID=151549 RepID=A0A4C1TP80_EUMVA|nr:hypothetical protein EVAR_93962_1 [Eumeta japonica]
MSSISNKNHNGRGRPTSTLGILPVDRVQSRPTMHTLHRMSEFRRFRAPCKRVRSRTIDVRQTPRVRWAWLHDVDVKVFWFDSSVRKLAKVTAPIYDERELTLPQSVRVREVLATASGVRRPSAGRRRVPVPQSEIKE